MSVAAPGPDHEREQEGGQGGMTSEEGMSVQAPFRPSFKVPVPESPIVLAPIHFGICQAIPSFDVTGGITATKSDPVPGPTVVANMETYQAEVSQEYDTACGKFGLEFTGDGMTLKFMAEEFPMEMNVSGNSIVFKSEPQTFSYSSGGWTFTGNLGFTLKYTIVGQPEAVARVLALATSYSLMALIAGKAFLVWLEKAAIYVGRRLVPALRLPVMPIIIITPEMRRMGYGDEQFTA